MACRLLAVEDVPERPGFGSALGRLAGLGRKAARGRAAELVTAFGLEAASARQVKSYSRGCAGVPVQAAADPAALDARVPVGGQVTAALSGLVGQGIAVSEFSFGQPSEVLAGLALRYLARGRGRPW